MDQDTELRQMFGIAHPGVYASISDNNDIDLEGILDVELPKKKKMKSRGRPFTSEENNPQKARWKCLECDMESNLTGVMSCLLYTSPSPRDGLLSRMPSSA